MDLITKLLKVDTEKAAERETKKITMYCRFITLNCRKN